MTPQVWNATAAVAAFMLGVFNFWHSVIRPSWRNRRAQPEARLEVLAYQTRSGWDNEERVVLVNHGPAKMKQVTIRLKSDEGQEQRDGICNLWPELPIPVIHVGQTFYLPLLRSFGERATRSVVIQWHDGRRGEQEQEIWLSSHHLT